ncbi:MAG: hypothetical protein U0414_40400 [Polyangiaceae bacterium]
MSGGEALSPYFAEGALEGERLYSGRPGAGIVVTSRRVIFEEGALGRWERREIFLEHVSYVGVEAVSQPLLLALGLFALLAALFEQALGRDALADKILLWGGASIGAFFILAYGLSRAQKIVIASSGGRIHVTSRGLPPATIVYLLGRLAAAKSARERSSSRSAWSKRE